MDENYLKLKKIIAEEVFVTKDKERIVDPSGADGAWLFDFRRVLLKGSVLDLIVELFWEKCKDNIPFR